MPLDVSRLRADGFTDDEIKAISTYCGAVKAKGQLNRTASLIMINGEYKAVTQTIAEILDYLRPGTWLRT